MSVCLNIFNGRSEGGDEECFLLMLFTLITVKLLSLTPLITFLTSSFAPPVPVSIVCSDLDSWMGNSPIFEVETGKLVNFIDVNEGDADDVS